MQAKTTTTKSNKTVPTTAATKKAQVKKNPPVHELPKPEPTLLQLIARPYDAVGEAIYRLDAFETLTKHNELIDRLSKVSDELEAIHDDVGFMFFGQECPGLGDSDYDYGPGWPDIAARSVHY